MKNIMKNVQKIMNHSEASEFNNRRILDGVAWKAYNEYLEKQKKIAEQETVFDSICVDLDDKPDAILASVPAQRATEWIATHTADAEVWLSIYRAAQADYKDYTGNDYFHPKDPDKPSLSAKDGTKATMLEMLKARKAA